MSLVPNTMQKRISNNVSFELNNYFKWKTCDVFQGPFDARLQIPSAKKNSKVVQPDWCIIYDESKLDVRGCTGVPDLMVEIISPNNSKHDIYNKFNLYQEARVKEYRIIEPNDRILLFYA